MFCPTCGCENPDENIQCEVCGYIFESKSKKSVKINQMNVMVIATISFIVFIIIGIVGINFLNSDYFEKKEMLQAIESKDCRQVISVLEEQSTYNVAVKTLDDYLTEIYYDICNNENIYDISDAIQYLHDISGTILIDENNNIPLQKYGSCYIEITEEGIIRSNWDDVDKNHITGLPIKINEIFDIINSKISYQEALGYFDELEKMNSEGSFNSITYICVEFSVMQVLEDDCNYEVAQQLLEELNKKYGIYMHD